MLLGGQSIPVLFVSKRKIEGTDADYIEKERLVGGKVMVIQFKSCQEKCGELFFRVTVDRKRRHGHKLQQRRFKLDTRKMFT